MMDVYTVGTNVLLYQPVDLQSGKSIIFQMFDPTGNSLGSFPLTDKGNGLYFLSFNFTKYGPYTTRVLENDVYTVSSIFRVISFSSYNTMINPYQNEN